MKFEVLPALKNIDDYYTFADDIEFVKNAIKYKWTNGLVEGHVNRLKNK